MLPLESTRVARILGALILAKGALILLFWKIFSFAIAIGMERYSNASGKMAKFFFKQDRMLLDLLKFGQSYMTLLLVLGIIVSAVGILFIAFPDKTAQILCALRILRKAQ